MPIRNSFNKEKTASNGFLANIERISESTNEILKDNLTYIVNNIKKSEKAKKKRRVPTKEEKGKTKSSILLHKELETQTSILTNIHESILEQTKVMSEHHNQIFSVQNTTPPPAPTQEKKKARTSMSERIDNISKSGDALGSVGKGLVSLSGGIVAFALALSIVNPVTAGFMLLSVLTLGKVLQIFYNMIKEIDISKFEMDLTGLSIGILAFGLSLTIATPLLITGLPGLLLLGGELVAFSLILKLVDLKKIKQAEESLVDLSVGILSFAISLAVISKMDFDLTNLFILGGALLILSVGIWALSKVGFSNIIEGSISIAILGGGILIFSLAFKLSTMLIGDDWGAMLNAVGMFAVSVLIVGAVTAIAGMALPLIAAGTASLILMGIGMLVFGLGVKAVQALNIDEKTGEIIGSTLKNVFNAFTSISLKDIVKVSLALPAIIGLGFGLSSLAMGVRKFAELDSKYKLDYTSLGKNISNLLTTVKDVFAEIGGNNEGSTQSLVGLLFGRDMGRTPVERGIASVRDLGEILNSLADGIGKWADLDKNFPNLNYKVISDNISKVLNMTTDIFRNIGLENNTRDSIFEFIFGNDFGKTPVERGIASVRDLGEILNSLADGIGKWADLDKNFPNLNYDAITKNIGSVLQLTSGVFAKLGAEEGGFTSYLDFLIGTDLGSTDVERGIASVRDLGRVLVDLADGITKWNDLGNLKGADGKPISLDPVMIAGNIEKVLTILPEVFSRIGKKSEHSSWYQLDTDMEKGLDLAVELSDKLNLVSDSVLKFNSLKQPASLFDSIAKSYERISVAVQKMPIATLSKLNDLFQIHYQVITTDNGENSLKQLVDSIKDMLLSQGIGNNVQGSIPPIPFLQGSIPQQQVSNNNNRNNNNNNAELVGQIQSLISAQGSSLAELQHLAEILNNGIMVKVKNT